MVFLANAISLNMFDTKGVLKVKKLSHSQAYEILQSGCYSIVGHEYMVKYLLHDFNHVPIKKNRETIKVNKEDKILFCKMPPSSFYTLKNSSRKKRKQLLSSKKQIFEYYLITTEV